jgi:hypothetical protein
MTNIEERDLTAFDTREAWLHAAAGIMSTWFASIEDITVDVPTSLHVSAGWAKGAKAKSVGWCYKRECHEGGGTAIFITPEYGDADVIKVLATLLHELCHAYDANRDKHGGRFKALWRHHGFTGKATCSTPSEALEARLRSVADQLGPYPAARMNLATQVKPQGTRMLKVAHLEEDGGCGYVIRTTRKHLETYGAPFCPCNAGLADDEDESTGLARMTEVEA